METAFFHEETKRHHLDPLQEKIVFKKYSANSEIICLPRFAAIVTPESDAETAYNIDAAMSAGKRDMTADISGLHYD